MRLSLGIAGGNPGTVGRYQQLTPLQNLWRAENLHSVPPLMVGDCVKTQFGEVGRVVHVSRLTLFVAIPSRGKADRVPAMLADCEFRLASVATSAVEELRSLDCCRLACLND